ncbi:hypothetical protein AAU57_13080 [Nonlabens sp. YIK11]|uniref:hypothetical protein n=1 Tax=Nonlabens sp. YIK11 TaxID=1453349 RepID=UPI0006DC899C|nr:hypothetical protein [Nonlabens sp. YIK11]KQC34162.1 hypothetical protein AAU57_13080 [Nonlabens sp. YIK11]
MTISKYFAQIFIYFFLGYISFAQSNFYPGKLTASDQSEETIYFKLRKEVVNKDGTVNVYRDKNNSSILVLKASDFKKILADDGSLEIISAYVENIESNNVVLRKLVDADESLYIYNNQKQVLYVNGSFEKGYQVLAPFEKDGQPIVGYKRWLYNNLNPNNNAIDSFTRLSYSQDDLVKYYLANSANANKLEQEKKVAFFNLGLHAGYSSNNFAVSSPDISYDNLKASNIRIGVKAELNLNRITNNFTLIAGVDYFTIAEGRADAVRFPESVNNTKAEYLLQFDYYSLNIGAQYNFHLKTISIAPFVSFEPIFYGSNTEISVNFEDGQPIYSTNNYTGSSIGFNLGLKFDFFSSFYSFIEYSSMADMRAMANQFERQITIDNDLKRITFAIGYTIF